MTTNRTAWVTMDVGDYPIKVGRIEAMINDTGDLELMMIVSNPTVINVHAVEGVVFNSVIMNFMESVVGLSEEEKAEVIRSAKENIERLARENAEKLEREKKNDKP